MLITQIANWTVDMWSPIIGLFNFVPDFGWMIILFTVCLKLLLSPLDFWQRKVSRASAMKQEVLKPELMKLQKKFANNRQMLNQKTQELYKRENFNMLGSCMSMLVNMVLTLFIFITLFYALMGVAQVNIANQYTELQNKYNEEFKTKFSLTTDAEVADEEQDLWTAAKTSAEAELRDEALAQAQEELGSEATPEQLAERADAIYSEYTDTQKYNKTIKIYSENASIQTIQQAVLAEYENIREGWLWISSVWRPDTNASAFPSYADYVNLSNFYSSEEYQAALTLLGDPTEAEITELKQGFLDKYNFVTYEVQKLYQGGNGYFILVILAALVTFISITISQRQTTKKKDPNAPPQPGMNATKIMKFILPAMMVIFTISYSAAFAIYIVTNSLMATLLSFVFLKYFEHKEKKPKIDISDKPASTQTRPSGRPDYSR